MSTKKTWKGFWDLQCLYSNKNWKLLPSIKEKFAADYDFSTHFLSSLLFHPQAFVGQCATHLIKAKKGENPRLKSIDACFENRTSFMNAAVGDARKSAVNAISAGIAEKIGVFDDDNDVDADHVLTKKNFLDNLQSWDRAVKPAWMEHKEALTVAVHAVPKSVIETQLISRIRMSSQNLGGATASCRLYSSWSDVTSSHPNCCSQGSLKRSRSVRRLATYSLPLHRRIAISCHPVLENWKASPTVLSNDTINNIMINTNINTIRSFGNQATSEKEDDNSKNKNSDTGTKKDIPGSATSDPPVLTWIDEYLPEPAKPYARLARIDKPIGTWLLIWPCFWSTALASASQGSLVPDPLLIGLFGAGAVVMRGAGCTINDLWDRDIDAKVTRTKARPIAGGDVTIPQAIGFLAAQLSIGLGVLVSLPHTWYCFQWGAASLPLVALYPLTKRFLPWPQLFLGVTMNWGAWMGWAATYGTMDYSILPFLYGSGVTWTLVYDTIYAHQDKQEDASLGLNSTALAFGRDDAQQKRVLHGLAVLTWLQWLAVGNNASEFLAFPYYQAGVTTAYAHLVWQIHTADFNNPHNVMARFRSNSAVGAVIFGSIAVGGLLQ